MSLICASSPPRDNHQLAASSVPADGHELAASSVPVDDHEIIDPPTPPKPIFKFDFDNQNLDAIVNRIKHFEDIILHLCDPGQEGSINVKISDLVNKIRQFTGAYRKFNFPHFSKQIAMGQDPIEPSEEAFEVQIIIMRLEQVIYCINVLMKKTLLASNPEIIHLLNDVCIPPLDGILKEGHKIRKRLLDEEQSPGKSLAPSLEYLQFCANIWDYSTSLNDANNLMLFNLIRVNKANFKHPIAAKAAKEMLKRYLYRELMLEPDMIRRTEVSRLFDQHADSIFTLLNNHFDINSGIEPKIYWNTLRPHELDTFEKIECKINILTIISNLLNLPLGIRSQKTATRFETLFEELMRGYILKYPHPLLFNRQKIDSELRTLKAFYKQLTEPINISCLNMARKNQANLNLFSEKAKPCTHRVKIYMKEKGEQHQLVGYPEDHKFSYRFVSDYTRACYSFFGTLLLSLSSEDRQEHQMLIGSLVKLFEDNGSSISFFFKMTNYFNQHEPSALGSTPLAKDYNIEQVNDALKVHLQAEKSIPKSYLVFHDFEGKTIYRSYMILKKFRLDHDHDKTYDEEYHLQVTDFIDAEDNIHVKAATYISIPFNTREEALQHYNGLLEGCSELQPHASYLENRKMKHSSVAASSVS